MHATPEEGPAVQLYGHARRRMHTTTKEPCRILNMRSADTPLKALMVIPTPTPMPP